MRVVLAEAMGMCFGVRDAIDLALREARTGPLAVLGELVHNPVVIGRLRAAGVEVALSVDDLRARRVLVSAHGTCDAVRALLRERGCEVIEATCPLVSRVHAAARRLAEEGFHVAVVGLAAHTEVRGIVGDLGEATVVLGDDDLDRLAGRARIGVVAQTTQPLPRVLDLVRRMRERFPEAEVRFVDTVCQPTNDRQLAAMRLASQVPVVIVVGAAHSNNTRELVATCARQGARTCRVAHAGEVREEWLAGADAVGVTAGTSVPDDVADAVVARLSGGGSALSAEPRHEARDAAGGGEREHAQDQSDRGGGLLHVAQAEPHDR